MLNTTEESTSREGNTQRLQIHLNQSPLTKKETERLEKQLEESSLELSSETQMPTKSWLDKLLMAEKLLI